MNAVVSRGQGVGIVRVEVGAVYDSTVSVTVPLVLFRMLTASSWETPSRVCPLTAMIWSPRFRRPSSAAAP